MIQIPVDQKFYLRDPAHLAAEMERLGLELPMESTGDALRRPLALGNHELPNRFCAQPITGQDANPDGSPSALTRRRYTRLATGGYGLIWMEATAVQLDVRRHPNQLGLDKENIGAFTEWTAALRDSATAAGSPPPLLILQLDHPCPEEDRVPAPETVCDRYQRAAEWACLAGFDGVDLRCDTGILLQELNTSLPTESLLERIACAILHTHPHLLVAARLCAYTACLPPHGFGTDPHDHRQPNLHDPIELIRRLNDRGVALINVTSNHPNLRNSPQPGNQHPLHTDAYPHEHPLTALNRRIQIAKTLRESVPGIFIIVDGLSWLRHMMPMVAGGLVRDGHADLIGLGRFALAYPDAPTVWFSHQALDAYRCCVQCRACSWLKDAGAHVGCVLQDGDVYGAEFRAQRRYSPDRLQAEAQRCHQCYPAPCVLATPGHVDIPRHMSSCAHGDLARAGKRLRREQMLPEMCAQLAPAGAAGEIACIENTLSGRPIPIRDLQYSAARALRQQGGSAVRLPSECTGRHISIIGAGPAGLAASAVLLEQGHTVTLYEKSAQLGGVPERLIPASRYGGAQAEIEALLTPALPTGRLTLHRNTALGVDRTLTAVRKECDAVLLTAGLWQELSLQSADGVWSGLNFLEQVKRGRTPSPPRRAALLSGGDCAMDAACCLKELGTEQIFILFGGARSDMHWCMEEHWFAQPGVHALFFARPLGYLLNTQGHVTHVRVARMELNEESVPHDVPGGEYTIAVDTVIEAMGLTTDATLRGALQELNFTSAGLLKTISTDSFHTAINPVFAAGALINGGASVPQCVSEGMRAAQEIDHWLTSP